MNPKNIFSELKRRNVYKVAVAYAVVSWLLIQAASILFPTFEAPSWVMKTFVVFLGFGFPRSAVAMPFVPQMPFFSLPCMVGQGLYLLQLETAKGLSFTLGLNSFFKV